MHLLLQSFDQQFEHERWDVCNYVENRVAEIFNIFNFVLLFNYSVIPQQYILRPYPCDNNVDISFNSYFLNFLVSIAISFPV